MNPNQQESAQQSNAPETPINYDQQSNPEIQNPVSAPIQEASPLPPATQPAAQLQPVIDDSVTSQAINADDARSVASDLIADDGDLIEKEWVDRAKSVVDSTRDNPHAQNKEMNEVKKDYLKKRYNKDLVVEDE